MSHFSSIKIQIKDSQVLQEILSELGYRVEKNQTVRGYLGTTVRADYVIEGADDYDIGFDKDKDGHYVAIADWSLIGINKTKFINEISQKYAYKTLLNTIEQEGFELETEELLADGTVRLVVAKWV